MTVCQPALKWVKIAVHQFSTKNVKGMFAVCITTYSDFIRLALYFVKISFPHYQGAVMLHAQQWLLAVDFLSELTAKKGPIGIHYGPNSTWLDLTRLDTFDSVERVESTRLDTFDFVEPCFSNMVDNEEAVVLACTSLVFCVLSVHVSKTEKRQTRCVGERLSEKKIDFWMLQFSSDVRLNESQSDLVKLHAHQHQAIWGTF